MFTLIAQNKYGEQLELTHNSAYVIESIDGIDPPDAVINTTRNANADGSVFNSSYIDNRQITITLAINGPAEPNRIALYQYFKSKYPVRLFYKNGTRDVYIDGYVQNIQIAFFEKKQIAQITVICPNPLFNGVMDSVTEFSHVEDLFEFPFSIESEDLFTITAESTETAGITYTIDEENGTVTATGTATAAANIILGSISLKAGQTYGLHGCPEGGGGSTYRLYWQGISGNYDEGEGCYYTPEEDETRNIRVVVYTGATVDDLVFTPVVQCAEEAGIEFSSVTVDTEESIINGGDVDSGVVITIHAVGTVENPAIYNLDTNESFILNYTMNAGDDVIINTHKKQKSVVLMSGGVQTNIIGYMQSGSTWFQLVPGDNLFTIASDSSPEYMEVSFTITNQFEGV